MTCRPSTDPLNENLIALSGFWKPVQQQGRRAAGAAAVAALLADDDDAFRAMANVFQCR